mgnify:CR=1 FL=1
METQDILNNVWVNCRNKEGGLLSVGCGNNLGKMLFFGLGKLLINDLNMCMIYICVYKKIFYKRILVIPVQAKFLDKSEKLSTMLKTTCLL